MRDSNLEGRAVAGIRDILQLKKNLPILQPRVHTGSSIGDFSMHWDDGGRVGLAPSGRGIELERASITG